MATLISDRMAQAMSEQIGREYFASIQYRMICAYFDREALPSLARLFREQAAEEEAHALKFIDYITEAGGVAAVPSIEQGKSAFVSVEEAVQAAYDSEIRVTNAINALMDLAIEENDHLARGLLQWFVDEQLEEVNRMGDLLKVVQRAGNDLNYVEQYVAALPRAAAP